MGERLPELVTARGLGAGRVNLSIARGCVVLPLPPTHLVERQKERRRESLCTHPLENDKFGEGGSGYLWPGSASRRADLVPSKPFDKTVAVVVQRQRQCHDQGREQNHLDIVARGL